MRPLLLPGTVAAAALAITLSGCGGSNGAAAVPQQSPVTNSVASSATQSAHRTLRGMLGATSIIPVVSVMSLGVPICAKPTDPTHAGCFATRRADGAVVSEFTDALNGLTPRDLSLLYAYPSPGSQGSAGSNQTVAVVVAGNYALAQSDLGVYRAHFGLPACTVANGCLTLVGAGAGSQVSQTASLTSISAHPTTSNAIGWAAETDTDTQLVSAVCPNCKIVIAEAASDSLADLSAAAQAAINARATIINASYGAPEAAGDSAYSSVYNNSAHVKVVAAAGDWGFGVYYPASDNGVIAVGGTTLAVSGSSVAETAWSGTGSGCSSRFADPSWQHQPAVAGACSMRTVNDVSAVADPNTGVAIYDSSLSGIVGGWAIFGGTSISAPIITGMYALSGDTQRGQGAQTLYAGWADFIPVTSGSDGTCSPRYLCTATSGYNGPAGLGVPNGLGGF